MTLASHSLTLTRLLIDYKCAVKRDGEKERQYVYLCVCVREIMEKKVIRFSFVDNIGIQAGIQAGTKEVRRNTPGSRVVHVHISV